MAGLSKRNLTHNFTCIKELFTGTFCRLNAFSVLVNWHLVSCWFAPRSRVNQPMIQKLEETWCVKITSYRTFHGIPGLSFRSNFYTHCHLKILDLTETAILIVKFLGCTHTFTFHTPIPNKSKNIVFHVNFPPCLVFAFYLLQASISSYFTPLYIYIRRLPQFPLAYTRSIVLDYSFRKDSAIIFQYIFFKFDHGSSNSCSCLYTEELHLATTTFIRPLLHYYHSLPMQTWKSPSHFIILKTSVMRSPRYYDQDFMAKRWSHQRGSTVFFNFSVPHYRTKTKICASAGLWQLM